MTLKHLIAAGLLALTTATACTSDKKDDPAPTNTGPDLLQEAKAKFDSTSAVHFKLDSADLPESGTVIRNGEGDLVRPDKFKGKFAVGISGLSTTAEVISVGGKLWAKTGFTPVFIQTDPAQFGIKDPATLINPDTGLSNLLAKGTDRKDEGEVREGAEVLQKITTNVPGEVIGEFLQIADRSATVKATFLVNKDTKELRKAELTGPFYPGGKNTTYYVTITDYGKSVDIKAP